MSMSTWIACAIAPGSCVSNAVVSESGIGAAVCNAQCSVHAAPDFGIVILLTPGLIRRQPIGSAPTVIIHTVDLNWTQLAHWYQHGQPLVVSPNRTVPVECWSPHMKTRSRMHYFLADQHALASQMPHAGAIMLSLDGMLYGILRRRICY